MKYEPANPVHRATLATDLIRRLVEAGFTEDTSRSTAERIFRRQIEGVPDGWIVVYTTVFRDLVRSGGSDAIRVSGVIGDRGVWKCSPVHRTGTIDKIIERTIERARETWVGVRRRARVTSPLTTRAAQ